MDPFLGEIRLFSWNWAPKGWALCQGQLLAISSNAALFALLGTQYGGNGTTNFALPDLRGRVPVHFGGNYTQGEIDGTENASVSIAQMPNHNHNLMGYPQAGDKGLPNGFAYANPPNADPHYAPDTAIIAINPTTVHTAGGNQDHPNMQPYLVLNYCIATSGVFPPRN